MPPGATRVRNAAGATAWPFIQQSMRRDRAHTQIFPLDQLDLPVPLPAAQLLTPPRPFIRPLVGFDIHQPIDAIRLDEQPGLTAPDAPPSASAAIWSPRYTGYRATGFARM